MQAVAGKTVAELPLVDWEEASMNCGGDMRDDAFLVDLMVCFCTEGIPRVKRLLQAALAYRRGEQTFAAPGDPGPRSIELVIKEEAHALKGSAANVRLWRLAKACEECELPCKAIVQGSYPGGPSGRKALLDSFCIAPRTQVSEVVHQYRAFIQFLQADMPGMLEEGLDLETSLEGNTLQELRERCTVPCFEEQLSPEWGQFNEVSPTAAAAALAGAAASATAAGGSVKPSPAAGEDQEAAGMGEVLMLGGPSGATAAAAAATAGGGAPQEAGQSSSPPKPAEPAPVPVPVQHVPAPAAAAPAPAATAAPLVGKASPAPTAVVQQQAAPAGQATAPAAVAAVPAAAPVASAPVPAPPQPVPEAAPS